MTTTLINPISLLRHIHPRLAGRVVFIGGGGGHTTSTVTQQNIPEEFYPYFERMLVRGEEASLQPYTPYEGQRLAGQTADTLASQGMVRDVAMRGQPALDMAAGMTAQNAADARALASREAYQFSPYAGFQESEFSPYAGFQEYDGFQEYGGFQEYDGFQEFGFDPARQFTTAEAEQYMSPYIQSVLDVQQREAEKAFERSRSSRAAQAAAAGAFGGSRAAVQEAVSGAEYRDQLARMQAEGLQSAYSEAQRTFMSDRETQMMLQRQQAAEAARVQGLSAEDMARVQAAQAVEAARVQAERAREAARVQAAQAGELARVQGLSAGEVARIQAAQAAEAARVQAGQAGENFARDQFSLGALGQSSGMAQQLAALSEQARSGDIQAAQLLDAMGRSNEARDQAELDIAYQDFLRQQGYPMEQQQQFSSMLHGLPIQPAGTTTQQVPYNPIQQALGMGISALSLYRGMQG